MARASCYIAGTCAILSTIAPSGPAFGADRIAKAGFEAGNVLVRGRITGILPYDENSRISQIGGQVDVPPMLLPDIDISVFLSDRWSVSGQTGILKTRIKLKQTLYGDIDVGTVWDVPVSLAMQYHFAPRGRIRPYAGAGLTANWYFGEKPASEFVRGFKVSTVYAPLMKGGFDYRIDDRWSVNAEVRQIFVPTQTIENQGVRARTSLKTVTAGVGIGYRF